MISIYIPNRGVDRIAFAGSRQLLIEYVKDKRNSWNDRERDQVTSSGALLEVGVVKTIRGGNRPKTEQQRNFDTKKECLET